MTTTGDCSIIALLFFVSVLFGIWNDFKITDSRLTFLISPIDLHYEDKILFIKEASTCNYVVVIHTPRLCGEPGFKSERDTQEESVMRCREIISEDDQARHTLLSASLANDASSSRSDPEPTAQTSLYSEDAHPMKFPFTPKSSAPPSPPPPPPVAQKDNTADDASQGQDQGTKSSKSHQNQVETLKQALQALLKSVQGDAGNDQPFGDRDDVLVTDGEDGEKVYFIIDDMEVADGLDHLMENVGEEGRGRLEDIRKKIMDLVKNSGSVAQGEVSNDADTSQQNAKEDGEDSVPATHDEL